MAKRAEEFSSPTSPHKRTRGRVWVLNDPAAEFEIKLANNNTIKFDKEPVCLYSASMFLFLTAKPNAEDIAKRKHSDVFACFEVMYGLKTIADLGLTQMNELMSLASCSASVSVKSTIVSTVLQGDKGHLVSLFSGYYNDECCAALLDAITNSPTEFPIANLSRGAWKRLLFEKWINCSETELLAIILGLPSDVQGELVPLLRLEDIPLTELVPYVDGLKCHQSALATAFLKLVQNDHQKPRRNLQIADVPYLEKLCPFKLLRYLGKDLWFPTDSIWEPLYLFSGDKSVPNVGTLVDACCKALSSLRLSSFCVHTMSCSVILQGQFALSRVLQNPARNVYTASPEANSFVLMLDSNQNTKFYVKQGTVRSIDVAIDILCGEILIGCAVGEETFMKINGGLLTSNYKTTVSDALYGFGIYSRK